MQKYLKIGIRIVVLLIIVLLIYWFVDSNYKMKKDNSLENILQYNLSNSKELDTNIIKHITAISENNVVSTNNIIENVSNNTHKQNVTNTKNDIISKIEDKEITLPNYKQAKYGSSENGRDLIYYSLAPDNYENTLLFVFAIHGYEDDYDKDGQILVDTANYLKNYYKENDVKLLHNNRLLIVACANPDGLYDGNSCNGFGRCNAKGIDLNRDFDVIHKVSTNSRNYTPYPFSAKESRALADLIKKERPTVVLDFHGWLNYTIGDGNLAKIFKENMSLSHKTEFNNNCNGYLSYWAHKQGASSLLVEFKNDSIPKSDLKITIDEILETF